MRHTSIKELSQQKTAAHSHKAASQFSPAHKVTKHIQNAIIQGFINPMFKQKRQINFLKEPPSEGHLPSKPVKLGKLAKAAADEFGNQVLIKGETVDTRDRVKHVVDQTKRPNKEARCDLSKKIDVSFDMPNNVPAIWDHTTNRMVLNGKVALVNPEHIPFWVAHEASHGGLMKETEGTKIQSEGLADFIAKRATGMDIGSDYSPELAKIEEIAKIIEESGAIKKDAGKAVIKFNVRDDMTGLLKLLVRAFVKKFDESKKGDSSEPVNEALKLFRAAFPKAQIMQGTPEAEQTDSDSNK